MLIDYFSCYELSSKSTPSRRKKNYFNLKIVKCFLLSKFWGMETLVFKKFSAYHTGSAFTQHFYVCKNKSLKLREVKVLRRLLNMNMTK